VQYFSRQQFDSPTVLKCIVSYNKYGGYCVPESSRHRPAAKTILSNDVHEPKTIEYLISNCADGDIVHAGTYFGDFLPALSQACSSKAKIWAFEPNPENYKCARITTYINDINNVELINAGLGERKEMLVMLTSDKNGKACGGASKILTHETDNIPGGTQVVQILTIDETILPDRKVSIIQLDVEGHEKQALSGALKTIQRCLPIIIVEVNPKSTLIESAWFTENILVLGYKITKFAHGNAVLICNSP
jgi:FkbM family methyltransferase